jgi:hypothetical protein
MDDSRGRYLIQMGQPQKVNWWKQGRPATREEVQESIDTGLPSLEAVARQDNDIESLRKSVERFSKWLPPTRDQLIWEQGE